MLNSEVPVTNDNEESSPSHQSKTKLEKAPSVVSPLAQERSQADLLEAKTVRGTPSPCSCNFTKERAFSRKSQPAWLKGFDNTAQYSVFQQSVNFPLQNQMHSGVALPNLIEHTACYKHELSNLYLFPLNCLQPSYQGFAMPNPDIGGLGGYSNQATVNRHVGMNMEPLAMHPSALTCYGHDYNNQLGPAFRHC